MNWAISFGAIRFDANVRVVMIAGEFDYPLVMIRFAG